MGSLLIVSLLLSGTSTANAFFVEPPSLPDPYVSPVSGDMEFTTELLPVQQFPGTQDYNQMLVPVGFTLGQAQFLDTGVVVSGMDSGKATACFTFTGAQSGWGGKVGVWNGTKWVLLATTIKNLEESPNSLACAPITGNGTYAFIRYVADPSLLPTCAYDTSAWYGGFSGDGHYFYARVNSLPSGTVVTYTVIVPDLNLSVASTGSTISYGPPGYIYADFSDNPLSWEEPWTQITLRISALGCSKDIVYRFPFLEE